MTAEELQEAKQLKERFKYVKNRTDFARDFGVPGGDRMIYQHITGRKPISLEAGRAYARGFNCALANISRRLNLLVNPGPSFEPPNTTAVTKNRSDPSASVTPLKLAANPLIAEISTMLSRINDEALIDIRGQLKQLVKTHPRNPPKRKQAV